MHGDLGVGLRHARVEQAHGQRFVDGVHRGQARHAGQAALQRRGQRRFVELHHHGRLQAPGHLGAVCRDALGQRRPEVPKRTGIGDGPVSPGQFEVRGQRDGTGRLQLDRAAAAAQTGLLPRLFERVEILAEQAHRAAQRRTAPRCDPVPARHGVDTDVDQKRPGAADQIGADAAGRQLHQMRQRVQFTDDDLGGLPRRGPRPGSDTGRGRENTHGVNDIRRMLIDA